MTKPTFGDGVGRIDAESRKEGTSYVKNLPLRALIFCHLVFPCAAQGSGADRYPITGEASGFKRQFFSGEEATVVERYLHANRRGEVYAWTCLSGGMTAFPYKFEVRTVGEYAELRIDQGARGYDWRRLEAEELSELETFLADNDVDRWPARVACISDAPYFQFVHLTPNSGHRFWANVSNNVDPDRGKPLDQYEKFYVLSERLLHNKPTRTVYTLLSYLPGSRILWEGKGASIISADSQGLFAQIRLPDGSYRWNRLDDSGLRGESTPNRGGRLIRPWSRDWALSFEGKKLVATDKGLMLEENGESRLLAREHFENPVLGADLSALLLFHPGAQKLMLLDLSTLTFRDLGRVEQHFLPIAYLPMHSGFLIARQEYDLPNYGGIAEAYVLNPATNESHGVEGQLDPWLSVEDRDLQPASPGKFWAAVPDLEGTTVGLLDGESFAFEPVSRYPTLNFNSSQMWVVGNSVYVATGDILLLPLQQANIDALNGPNLRAPHLQASQGKSLEESR